MLHTYKLQDSQFQKKKTAEKNQYPYRSQGLGQVSF